MKTDLPALAAELKKQKSVALFIHVRPDGDAVGSALGLQSALTSLGVRADIYCADEIPVKFSYLENVGKISREYRGGYDAHVALDCSDEMRMGDLGAIFGKARETFTSATRATQNIITWATRRPTRKT